MTCQSADNIHWRITDPEHLLGAMRISLAEGGRFLKSRVAPYGPIAGEPNVSYNHKVSWGMFASGVDHDTIAHVLDWVEKESLQPNGDFYFPEEGFEYKDLQRVYRPMTFGKVAAWIDHPVIRKPIVLDRILQYQHTSGGCFHCIGDDPKNPEPPATIGTLNTSFLGHLMIALDMQEQAVAVGDWLKNWVDLNRPHIAQGKVYSQVTAEGELITEVGPGERVYKVVDGVHPQQEGWQTGTAAAYLIVLYETLRERWGADEAKAKPYLDAAIELIDFDDQARLDTYLWPSKCKVGWGAGELLRIMPKFGMEDAELAEKAYRVAERVAVFTFMDNQLPSGGWATLHYPLSADIPEIKFSYKPLKGTVHVPPCQIEGSKTIWLSGEEITGEFLGELKAIEEGVAAWINSSAE